MKRAPAACSPPWSILVCLWQTRSGCVLVLADHEPALSAWVAVCMRAGKVLAALPQILSGSLSSDEACSVSRDEACSCCRALGLLGRQHAGGELLSPAGICLCYKLAVCQARSLAVLQASVHVLLPQRRSS